MSLLPATPKEVVLSLIAQQNTLPVPLTEDNLYFGAARMNTDGVSTLLPVTAMLGGDYAGYATLSYKRLNLSQIYDGPPTISDIGGPTLYSMLDIVNRNLGMNFTTDDVTDTNVAFVGAGEQVNISVTALPGSPGYQGSFFFRFIRLRVTFPSALTNTVLGALVYPGHPDVADSKRNIAMMMWNYDFSADSATLKLNGNTWLNQSAVKTLMQEFGITDWPAPQVNGVTDYATANYPGSNTNFQRVTVQKLVSGSTYAGDALFHYNLS